MMWTVLAIIVGMEWIFLHERQLVGDGVALMGNDVDT